MSDSDYIKRRERISTKITVALLSNPEIYKSLGGHWSNDELLKESLNLTDKLIEKLDEMESQ